MPKRPALIGGHIRLLNLLILSLYVSCAAYVHPPAKGGSLIALVDHGRHSSLIIQKDTNEMYRYTHGDWDFYAKGEDSLSNALKALFWPTQAGLGRQKISTYFEPQFIRSHLADGAEKIYVFPVNTLQAQQLIKKLDKIYFKNHETLLVNKEFNLNFVHYPETYWAFNNSNQKVAEWMEELGVEVSGIRIFSNWIVHY